MERKEAIEVIKKNWPDSSFTMLREALETVIPELKESDDERIINRIKKAVEEYWSDEPLDGILAWLEKQEHKPADMVEPDILIEESYQQQADDIINMVIKKPAWSEEDEKLVKNLISTLSNLYARNLIEKETKEKYTNLLKSLKDRVQPQNTWKPSDEQMVALKHAFNDGSIAFADMKILATLYEQLKALHRYEQDT